MTDAEDLVNEFLVIPLLVSLVLIPVGVQAVQDANLSLGWTLLMYGAVFAVPAFLIICAAKSIVGSVIYGFLWFISSCVVYKITGDWWTPVLTILIASGIAYCKFKNNG